jgi:hypothetical protein
MEARVTPSPAREAEAEQTIEPPLSAAPEPSDRPGKIPHFDRLEMTLPIPPTGLERSNLPSAAGPAPTPEVALIKLRRLRESLEATPTRSPLGERDLARVLICAPPPQGPIVLPRPEMQGELARIAGAGPIPATRRRSRRLGSEAATLALVAGAAMICAVFALQRDSPSLPEALRLVGAHGGQELTMRPLNGAETNAGRYDSRPRRSSAPRTAPASAVFGTGSDGVAKGRIERAAGSRLVSAEHRGGANELPALVCGARAARETRQAR